MRVVPVRCGDCGDTGIAGFDVFGKAVRCQECDQAAIDELRFYSQSGVYRQPPKWPGAA